MVEKGKDGSAAHPRLLRWWWDDPLDPGRMRPGAPEVRALIERFASGSTVADLGGMMSTNLRLDATNELLRVHQPFVSRSRLLALQDLRRHLDAEGVKTPVAIVRDGATMFRCRDRWAELEPWIAHRRLEPSVQAYAWLFAEMGTVHRILGNYQRPISRPVVATAATPAALRRWIIATERTVANDPDAAAIVDRVHGLARTLHRQWPDTRSLPAQVVHGDVRLSSICVALDGGTVVFDVGFAAVRPRVHDLAYALVFMVRALHGDAAADEFAWDEVPRLIEAYEASAAVRLAEAERRAIVPLAVAITLYHVAIAGVTEAPEAMARNYAGIVDLGAWLLAHPTAWHEPVRADRG
ncbi:MAG: hypothetical protein M3440_08555 [Chloroflexota bacterium]|nr:hypothetical protein [Chloroflexota bacterium]